MGNKAEGSSHRERLNERALTEGCDSPNSGNNVELKPEKPTEMIGSALKGR